ncbi:hypothetical protein GCM10007140_01590 [Priestia taiwanensis]|uniref:Uncharacterized protein n=1 Tax=Priestia taiwanensis TaxID=1347902 RepID=A0A917AI75_9BACI|nr:hypothetical protein GCM10007140_01590 [Priestia taiwanensis]
MEISNGCKWGIVVMKDSPHTYLNDGYSLSILTTKEGEKNEIKCVRSNTNTKWTNVSRNIATYN